MPRASEYAFLWQSSSLKPLKCSGGSAMMVMNLALPSERFEGFRLDHCQGKAYRTKTLATNDGGAHRQQSTESGRGRNGEDDNNNGQGRQQQRARTTITARTTDDSEDNGNKMATTSRMTGKDGEDNRRGQQGRQGQQH
jgi:hypothetical protein